MSKLDGLIATRTEIAKLKDDPTRGPMLAVLDSAIAAERQSGERGDATSSFQITFRVTAYDASGYGDNRSRDFQGGEEAVAYAKSLESRFGAVVHRQVTVKPSWTKIYPAASESAPASPLPSATDPVAGVSELADELEDMLAYIDRVANAQTNWLSAIGRHGQWLRVHRDVILAALRARPNEETFAEIACLRCEGKGVLYFGKGSDYETCHCDSCNGTGRVSGPPVYRSLTVPEKKGSGE